MSKQWLHLVLVCAIVGSAGPLFAADLGKGKILFEWFENAAGGNVDQLVDGRNRHYPDDPNSYAWRDQFEGPVNRADYYGTRVRGYLYPPADGDYTFWIHSDDHSRLWLSTDEDPAHKVQLCQVNGSTGATEWTKFPEQKSAPVTLKAGRRYYIEALHRDGTGGDNLGAAWGGPVIGAGPVTIAGSYLAAFIRPVDLAASNPSPADGTEGITLPLLTWNKGLTAVFHHVYFGTDPQPPLAMSLSVSGDSGTYYHVPGLTPGVRYYWRVDELDADGTTVHTGSLWSFTAAPTSASGPVPPDSGRGVPTDAVLQWMPGMNAVEHEIYFGDNEADVAAGAASVAKGKQTLTTLDVGVMQGDKRYFWRVDETGLDGVKTQGPVWSFRTAPTVISDPNLLGWWKLDETTGTATDYSGHGNHGQINGGAQPVAGYAGGAIDFDGVNDYISTGKTAAALGIQGNHPKSVTAWVYTRFYNNGGVFDVGARTNGQDFCLRTRTGANQWRIQLWGTGFDQDFTYTSQNRWVHFAVVYDGQRSTCYADGVSVSSELRALDTSPTNPFQIGLYGWPQYYFNGVIDDVRLFDKALTPEEVQAIVARPEPLQASGPSPALGKVTDALQAVPLAWQPGDNAAQHDVYLTTDPNVARDADTTDTTGAYRGRIDANSYTPDPVLDWNDVYYWRVDQVSADGGVTPGRIWRFTVRDFLIVDDFESYLDVENEGKRIYETWIDGYADSSSGSQVGNLDPPFAERAIVRGGQQAMPLFYVNASAPHFSEAVRSWSLPQDWTVEGVDALTLYVHGNPRRFVQTSESSFSLSAAGTDIWASADEFRFAYKTLTGDGTIVLCVTDNGSGTNMWAKGGAMIRANNTPGSVNALATGTGGSGGGFSFQWRPTRPVPRRTPRSRR
jgi:hypothetical protein